MKPRTVFALVTLAVLVAVLATRAVSQPSQESDATQMQQEMMETWMKFASPGEPHEELMSLAGTWKTTTKMWMAGPDGPASESTGTSELEPALGGRWLMERHTGEMMGRPYEGIGAFGYDNFKEEYVGMWISNMNTALAVAYGTANEAGDVITMRGEMDEPLTGERDKVFKWIIRLEDQDRRIFEIHDLVYPEGKTKVVEIVYQRVKGG